MGSRWFLVALCLSGCSRQFAAPGHPPQLPAQPTGTRCDRDAGSVCASGLCADGFCCEHPCARDERCDAPGREGLCTQRQLGDPCDAGASCHSGFCADGICCTSACQGSCVQCDAPLSRGTCTQVPDDADPHRRCPGACSVCISGACSPVDPGTDPRSECAPGLACGFSQACEAVDGGPCSSDTDCAAGICLFHGCMSSREESLSIGFDRSSTSIYRVLAAATNASGDDALVLYTENPAALRDHLFDRVVVLLRQASQPWKVVALNLPDQRDVPTASALFQDRTLVVVFSSCNGAQCLLQAGLVSPYGAASVEQIDALAQNVDLLDLHAGADGALFLASSDARGYHLYRRDAPSWTVVGNVPAPAAPAPNGRAYWPEGSAFISLDLPSDAGSSVSSLDVRLLDGGSRSVDVPALRLSPANPCSQTFVFRPALVQPGARFDFSLACNAPSGGAVFTGSLDRAFALTGFAASDAGAAFDAFLVEGTPSEVVTGTYNNDLFATSTYEVDARSLADGTARRLNGGILVGSGPFLVVASAGPGEFLAAATSDVVASDGGQIPGGEVYLARVRRAP